MGARATVASDDVIQVIRQAILDGDFAPRQRLIETDLSSQFEVSRAAVRTALMSLENEGLVERMPNRGARVRAISVTEAVEIVEVRIGLEVLVARRAAERIDDDRIGELAALREDMREAVAGGNLMRYASLNQEMDAILRDVAGHALAKQLLERLLAQAARHQFRLAFDPHRASASVEEHAAIIDAVVARDPDAAEAATRSHLTRIIEAMRQSS
ncbi:DNA-binding GntR family transcriptional regulator [Brevibacterium sanguinis]|uniref:DNA-binding GntR family transcriptional regulator n=2 Tax=Brevibacterium TaxID=1696 RepID=A0A366IJE2_9MICO|nr:MULTISPECIES: GntR family transcriptional regulator [Brevibacterium]RBP65610.1 DNA-binding GntR family transcriptional regulator [Brevibacterium sanguinis]RBP72244.1 DNA-binding GntR family transcriptional regulator [Brevibacterium celere]